MVKQAKKSPAKKQKENFFTQFSITQFIPEKYQDLVFLLIPFLLLYVFFGDVFLGVQTFVSGDITSSKSMENYLAYARENGTMPLWNPYIFLGMPAYITEINARSFDLLLAIIVYVQKIFQSLTGEFSAGPTLYFYVLAVSTYFLLRSKDVERLAAFFGTVAVTFSTGMIIFIAIGHNTKMLTLCMIPLVFLILEKFRDKFNPIYFLLLILAIHAQLLSAHLQEIFYAFFAVMIFYIYFIIRDFWQKKKDEALKLIRSGVLFAAAALIAVFMSIDQYWAIYEYNPTSIRGTQSIAEKYQDAGKKSGEGLDYEYATNWSFSPGEMLTFIMPSFYGYGNSIYQGELSQNQPVEVNTYWGQMPFVDVPQYMGILVFVFALFGLYYRRKDPFVQFLGILSVVSLLISFGKTFPVFYDLMFYYFPLFDKFRVPSMILNLLQISFPILAALGISYFIKEKQAGHTVKDNLIKYFLFGFGGLFVLSIILKSGLENWYIDLLSQSKKVQRELFQYTYDMFMSDTMISSAIALIGIGLLWGYLKNKVSKEFFLSVVILLTIFDLFNISSRGMKKFDESEMNQNFEAPSYVSEIKKDSSLYRILNLKQDGSLGSVNQHSNYHVSFLLQDFYGYSGAKPRTYQDLVDVIGLSNPTLWRMLNVKYIVTDKPFGDSLIQPIFSDDKSSVQLNAGALPRAYFVNRFEVKPTLDVLNMIKRNEFDPLDVLFFETDQTVDLQKIDPPTNDAYVNITNYVFETIDMEVNATGNNLLFLGDTYYPVGWKALIDGKETKIYRANHGFRAIVVPQGKHKVEFKYEPQSYYLGKNISFGLNVIVLGVLSVIILTRTTKKLLKKQRT
ncbi:MAG: YfhO family protein [Bacteroidetes bacterium]|nr:YfhO family protein [Bacteroidota bacterium]MBU2583717.1 YfhO family protein [Bacteroidota bacterium]